VDLMHQCISDSMQQCINARLDPMHQCINARDAPVHQSIDIFSPRVVSKGRIVLEGRW
jgi:hypothetical protein